MELNSNTGSSWSAFTEQIYSVYGCMTSECGKSHG